MAVAVAARWQARLTRSDGGQQPASNNDSKHHVGAPVLVLVLVPVPWSLHRHSFVCDCDPCGRGPYGAPTAEGCDQIVRHDMSQLLFLTPFAVIVLIFYLLECVSFQIQFKFKFQFRKWSVLPSSRNLLTTWRGTTGRIVGRMAITCTITRLSWHGKHDYWTTNREHVSHKALYELTRTVSIDTHTPTDVMTSDVKTWPQV